jgi:hypothetical protein
MFFDLLGALGGSGVAGFSIANAQYVYYVGH